MTIFLPGKPVAYQRHRVNTRTGHVYNPSAYTAWKDAARVLMDQQWHDVAPRGPVSVVMEFRFVSRNGLREGPHVTRPDCDNLVKAVLDAGNGILWLDDSQVYRIEARKVWAETSGTVVQMEV